MRETKDAYSYGQLVLSASLIMNYSIGWAIMKLTRYPLYYNQQSVQSLVTNPIRIFMGTMYIMAVFMLSLIIFHIDHKMAAINSKVWVFMMAYCTFMDFFIIQIVFVIVSRYCMSHRAVSFYEKLCYWRGFAKFNPEDLCTKV